MTDARAGGLAREVLRANTGSLHAGGVAREVIRVSTGIVRVGGVVREVLVQDVKDQLRIGGVVREALVTTGATSPATKILVDGLVREALVFVVGPAQAHAKPWARDHALLTDDTDEVDLWSQRRRGSAAAFVPPPPVQAKPWARHEFPEDEPTEWMMLIRQHNTHGVPTPPPPTTRLRPYLLINA